MKLVTCIRPLVILTGLIAIPVPLLATDFTWQGGDGANILSATNWVGGSVPPNDGININLTATDRILFIAGAQTIPDVGGAQINIPAGAQIMSTNGGDKVINARVNVAGAGPAGAGAITGGDRWIQPQNLFLTGA